MVHIIVKNKKSGTDPHRVQKDELCHRLWGIHKGRSDEMDLDMGEMAAGAMLAKRALTREGIELSAGETLDLVGEMAHAIKGKTELAGKQVALMEHTRALEAKRSRQQKAAALQRKMMGNAAEMLERGKKR